MIASLSPVRSRLHCSALHGKPPSVGGSGSSRSETCPWPAGWPADKLGQSDRRQAHHHCGFSYRWPQASCTTHLLRGARPSRRSHGHEPPARVQPAASRHPGLLLLLPSPTTATCTSAKRLLLRTAFVSPPHVNGGGGGLRRGRLMRWGDLSRKPQRLPGLNERYTPACGWMQGAGSVARGPGWGNHARCCCCCCCCCCCTREATPAGVRC